MKAIEIKRDKRKLIRRNGGGRGEKERGDIIGEWRRENENRNTGRLYR